jgi:hypothetical protein
MTQLKYWDDTSKSFQTVLSSRGPLGPRGPAGAVGPETTLAASGLWRAAVPFTNTNSPLVGNRLIYTRMYLDQAVDTAQIEVTTTATANAQIGVWEDVNYAPGNLVAQSGLASVSTTGVKNLTLALSPSATGYYWIGVVASGGALRAIASPNGLLPDINITAASAQIPSGWAVSGVSPGALPSPLTGTTPVRNVFMPVIYLRAV